HAAPRRWACADAGRTGSGTPSPGPPRRVTPRPHAASANPRAGARSGSPTAWTLRSQALSISAAGWPGRAAAARPGVNLLSHVACDYAIVLDIGPAEGLRPPAGVAPPPLDLQ